MEGNIIITGGSGSLGTAILERAERENWTARFTVIARNESKMNLVRRRFPRVNCVVGDVRDRDHLTVLFKGQDYIIHAAAIKIVPVAEANPREAVLTNIIGSENVAQAAVEAGVRRVVGISTDKACGPTYYGLTKRLMEGIFRQANRWGNTEFVLCRYGNVLGSSNSVVPFFMKQKEDNVPFTITDFDMTRFWLSMEQAVDLVLYTLRTANAGVIVVPKAPAMPVADLARVIDPEREQIEIGIRPGERLHEMLIVREEALHTIEEEKFFYIYPPDYVFPPHIKVLPKLYEYRSEEPAHWLTREEMVDLLKDSGVEL